VDKLDDASAYRTTEKSDFFRHGLTSAQNMCAKHKKIYTSFCQFSISVVSFLYEGVAFLGFATLVFHRNAYGKEATGFVGADVSLAGAKENLRMRKDKYRTIRRDVVFEDPALLEQEGFDLDDGAALAELDEQPEGEPVRDHAEQMMFSETQRIV
jgi:hypothetical protein